MMIDPQKLTQIASEWDPAPFMQALDTQPAMHPEEPVPGTFNYSQMMGQSPAGPAAAAAPGGMPMAMMGMQGLNMMQQGQAQQPQVRAPAAQPRRGAPMNMPAMPQTGAIPSLAQILGRR